jgi:hypothetical protein
MELVPHVIALSAARSENFVQRPSDVRICGSPIYNLHGKEEQVNDFNVLTAIDQMANRNFLGKRCVKVYFVGRKTEGRS